MIEKGIYILLGLLFILIFFGLFYAPRLQRIVIPENPGVFNKSCTTSKVECNTDFDCSERCIEANAGEEMVCRAFPRFTNSQKKNYGDSGKYCIPAKAKVECNISKGGIPVYTGWSNPERAEFDCLCSYPLYASSQVYDSQGRALSPPCQLNPGVCEGGTFEWDLTRKIEEPHAGLCKCPEGKTLVIDEEKGGIPRCVPSSFSNFYGDIDRIST